MKNDSDIKKDVEAELRCIRNVDRADIGVEVTGGIVTLTGFVRSYLARYRTETAVRRLTGVRRVRNSIQIAPILTPILMNYSNS